MEFSKIVQAKWKTLTSEEQGAYTKAWRAVAVALSEWALAQRPKLKVFEVHHLEIKAREQFQAVIVYAGTPARAAYVAATSIGLAWELA